MSKIKGAEVDTFSCIRPEGRAELVGKRFLLVPSNPKPKKSLSEWNWKAGVIRCASHVDSMDPELQVQPQFLFLLSYNRVERKEKSQKKKFESLYVKIDAVVIFIDWVLLNDLGYWVHCFQCNVSIPIN